MVKFQAVRVKRNYLCLALIKNHDWLSDESIQNCLMPFSSLGPRFTHFGVSSNLTQVLIASYISAVLTPTCFHEVFHEASLMWYRYVSPCPYWCVFIWKWIHFEAFSVAPITTTLNDRVTWKTSPYCTFFSKKLFPYVVWATKNVGMYWA